MNRDSGKWHIRRAIQGGRRSVRARPCLCVPWSQVNTILLFALFISVNHRRQAEDGRHHVLHAEAADYCERDAENKLLFECRSRETLLATKTVTIIRHFYGNRDWAKHFQSWPQLDRGPRSILLS